MKIPSFFVALITCLFLFSGALMQTGCSSQQLQETMTVAEAATWTAANAYETVNTATGGALTKGLLNLALTTTDNANDEAIVDAGGALADTLIKSQAAAATAKASPGSLQTIATTILSDPNVVNTIAASLPTQFQQPVTSAEYERIRHLPVYVRWVQSRTVYVASR